MLHKTGSATNAVDVAWAITDVNAVSWLTMTPTGGTLTAANDTVTITLTIDPTRLDSTTDSTLLRIESPTLHVTNPTIEMPVSVYVGEVHNLFLPTITR